MQSDDDIVGKRDRRPSALLIDERPEAWLDVLGQAGLQSVRAKPDDALEQLERVKVQLACVVVERDVPERLELMRRIASRAPSLPMVVLAAAGVLEEAQATEAGAWDLAPLPIDAAELERVVARVVALAERADAPGEEAHQDLLGASKPMHEVRDLIERVAPGNATILIRGESGTGKEVVARAIHHGSPRGSGPFVKVHCAALPDTLLESELFGYEKGAFTGAARRKPGRVELAEGGTLLLDEIGDITPVVQVKLLRLLQERCFERLGGTETLKADVRFLAATHRNLEAMVKKGEFREDLFYRLTVVPLWVPPLRARREDVAVMAEHFCREFAKANGKQGLELSEAALDTLRAERWPGNVRQLQNLIERLVVLSQDSSIDADSLKRELDQNRRFVTQHATAAQTSASLVSEVLPLEAEVRKAERRALTRALAHADGNRSVAARMLGVSRGTLYNKMREHGMS